MSTQGAAQHLSLDGKLNRFSNVVAYSINQNPPLPYRLRSNVLRLQIPSLSAYFPDSRFIRTMGGSTTWKAITKTLFAVRSWLRALIWGDRVGSGGCRVHEDADKSQLFLQFHGPSSILVQTRAARLNDVLTSQDVNEIADAQPGVVQPLVTLERDQRNQYSSDQQKSQVASPVTIKAPSMQTASIGSDGKVTFEPRGGSS